MSGLKECRQSDVEAAFKKYASQDRLNRNQLKDAFQQLGALMPDKHVEEAFKVADKNNDNVICGDEEFNSLVEYAVNNGFGNSY